MHMCDMPLCRCSWPQHLLSGGFLIQTSLLKRHAWRYIVVPFYELPELEGNAEDTQQATVALLQQVLQDALPGLKSLAKK